MAPAILLKEAEARNPELKEGRKKDKDKPERGIETMFRITSNNNQRLSDMADNKAHIMITVNSIILSAIISLLLGKINNKQDYLAIPYLYDPCRKRVYHYFFRYWPPGPPCQKARTPNRTSPIKR